MIPRPNLLKDLGRLFFWYPVRMAVEALPLLAVYHLGSALGRLDLWASGGRRSKTMAANLMAGLGVDQGRAREIVAANLMNHARNVLELIQYPRITPANLDRYVSFEGLEHLDAALKKGRGVILATAHYGAKQMLQAGLGHKGYKLTQLHMHLEQGELTWVQKEVAQKFRRRIERSIPCAFVSTQGFARPALECLKRGEILIIAADGIGVRKFMQRGYQPFTLLGQSMLMPVTWPGLVEKTGAAVLPAFAVRAGHRQRVVIEEELAPSQGGMDLVAAYARVLERRLRDRPDLWEFWEEFDRHTLLAEGEQTHAAHPPPGKR